MIVNEYLPGQGIAAHVDCIPCFGPTILSLSLGAMTVMNFRGPHGERLERVLQPRSLLVLSGEARLAWAHGIASRKTDVIAGARIARSRRVSLTFRTVTPKIR